MAYLNLVDYDEGGRIQSLDGLAEVEYDSGATRNLMGKALSAVKYDDGGRFRSLVGLGQDPSLDIPTDLPLAPSADYMPVMYAPPTPSPTFDVTSAPITGTLVDTTPPATPFVWTPSPTVDTVSTPAPGGLVDTTPPPAPPAQSILPSVLTSIFSGVKNVFGSTASTVKPAGSGTVVATVPATSWFSQTSPLGVPNWGMLAGVGVGGLLLMAAMRGSSGGGSSRKRNPARRFRKNPAELILMGANPYRGSARRRRMR